MRSFVAAVLASLALVSSVVNAASPTPTAAAKRFEPSQANTCYFTCPVLDDSHPLAFPPETENDGDLTVCTYNAPMGYFVSCIFDSGSGAFIEGQGEGNIAFTCPDAARNGPCDVMDAEPTTITVKKRNGSLETKVVERRGHFRRSLTPLERKIKERQYSPKKARQQKKRSGLSWSRD